MGGTVDQTAGQQGIQGNQPKRGELATTDGNDTVFTPYRMITALLGRIHALAGGNDRTDAGNGGIDIVPIESRLRKLAVDQTEQVIHFLATGRCLDIHILWMIQIRGAHAGHPLPGEHKHRATIVRMHDGEAILHRQTFGVHKQVAAAQGAHAGVTAGKTVCPGAGGTDHPSCTKRGRLLGGSIRHCDSVTFTTGLGLFYPAVILCQSTVASRLQYHPNHQAAVIGKGIGIAHGAGQGLAVEPRHTLQQLLTVQVTMITDAGKKIVQPENRLHRQPSGEDPFS